MCWLNEYTEGAETLARHGDRISALNISDGYLAIFEDALEQQGRDSEGKQVGDHEGLRGKTLGEHDILKYHSLVC